MPTQDIKFDPSEFNLEEFYKNPIVLSAHNFLEAPIGRVIKFVDGKVWVDKGEVCVSNIGETYAEVEFVEGYTKQHDKLYEGYYTNEKGEKVLLELSVSDI